MNNNQPHSTKSTLALFILLTCLISWAFGALIYFSDITIPSTTYSILGAIYMLIPATVAILLQKYWNREAIKKPLLISFKINRWFLVALLTPFILTFLSLGVSLLIPGVSFSVLGEGFVERYSSTLPVDEINAIQEQLSTIPPIVFLLITIGQSLIAGCTINAFFALGEELGWRAYMLRHLSDFSFMKVSLFTGFIWGLWHFPLILKGHNYPDHPVLGVFMMIVFCMLLSPVMTYLVIKSKSVISAAVFHGTINAVAGFPLLCLVGGNDLSIGLTGYAGFIAIAFVSLLFFLFDKFVTKENIFSKQIGKNLSE